MRFAYTVAETQVLVVPAMTGNQINARPPVGSGVLLCAILHDPWISVHADRWACEQVWSW